MILILGNDIYAIDFVNAYVEFALFTVTVASFMVGSAIASQNKETSSVTKHCWNGKCFLMHSFDQRQRGTSFYMSTERYDLDHTTPVVIKNKNHDIVITSGKELKERNEMRNYFPTECSLPEEFYVTHIDPSKESYTLEGTDFKASSTAEHTLKHTDHSKKFYVLKEKEIKTEKYAKANCDEFKRLIIQHIAMQQK